MEHLSKKMKMLIMIAIMSAMLFASLNMTIIGTVLPKIVSELGGMEHFSWVFTIYMLTSSVTAILVGRLSDIYGRKPFILTGIGIFIAGTFMAGLSHNMLQLIMFRAIQGVGGGMIMSTSFTAVGDLFPPRERGRWQGLMGAAFGVSSVLGPTLGGYIVDNLEWHWVFWVFLPFGLVAFALILKLFPHTDQKGNKEPIDYVGSLFLAFLLVSLLLAFSWGGVQYEWMSPQIIGLFVASVLGVILFIITEKRAPSPVLPLSMFRNGIFTLSNSVNFLTGMGMFGSVMFIPFFVQGVLGISATQSGLITMPMMVSMVITSAIAGQIISRTGKYKRMGVTGIIVMAMGMYSLSLMGTDTKSMTVVFNMILVGVGLGISFPVYLLTVQNGVSHKWMGVATSSVQLFRQLGGTIGVSLMGTLMAQGMAREMELRMASGAGNVTAELTPEMLEKLEVLKNPQILMDAQKMEGLKNSIPPQLAEIFGQIQLLMKESLSSAISDTFLFGFVVILIALVGSIFIKEIPLRTTNQEEPSMKDETQSKLTEQGVEEV